MKALLTCIALVYIYTSSGLIVHAEPSQCAVTDHRLIKRGNEKGCVDRQGRRQGTWHTVARNRTLSKTTYKDGEKHGIHAQYVRAERAAVEGRYTRGHKSDTWRYYDDSGRLEREETYHQGQLKGPYLTWHANCNENTVGHYEAGKRSKRWQFFNDEGVLPLKVISLMGSNTANGCT